MNNEYEMYHYVAIEQQMINKILEAETVRKKINSNFLKQIKSCEFIEFTELIKRAYRYRKEDCSLLIENMKDELLKQIRLSIIDAAMYEALMSHLTLEEAAENIVDKLHYDTVMHNVVVMTAIALEKDGIYIEDIP